jgi:integrase
MELKIARKAAGPPEEFVTHCLRRAGAKILAEAGVSEYQLMAVMGWTNLTQAMKYIEAARRRKMATGAYDILQTEQNKDKEK